MFTPAPIIGARENPEPRRLLEFKAELASIYEYKLESFELVYYEPRPYIAALASV